MHTNLELSINNIATYFSHCFWVDSVGEHDSSDYECDSGESQSTAACLLGSPMDTKQSQQHIVLSLFFNYMY